MSTLTMNPSVPHRKPLPAYAQTSPPPFAEPPAALQPGPRYGAPAAQGDFGHSRSRTTSSNVIPAPYNPTPSPPQQGLPSMVPSSYPQAQVPHTRRSLSSATSSTSNSNTNPGMQRLSTNSTYSATSAPRRSASSRSNTSIPATSYVALMRKQKATVWCDRAQHEDPRILAAQRAAKMRAAMEVAGGHNHSAGGRVSSSSSGMVGGVRSKIRHHGAPKASTYTGTMVSSAGVPMRLSATEVDEAESDDSNSRRYHSRTGSGRSSLASGHRGYNYIGPDKIPSNHSSVSSQSPMNSVGELPEDQTPMPTQDSSGDDYFAHPGGKGSGQGSSGSIQREENFGTVGGLPNRTRVKTEEEMKQEDELKRRGSVDDRTMTMGGGRLFVANPDLSD